MWEHTHEGRTSASTDAVWAALDAMLRGVALAEDGDECRLHGDLAPGSELTVTPHGQDSMTSVIREAVPGERYADRTAFGDLVLTFRHDLRTAPGGGAVVAHTVQIDGPGADDLGPQLGPGIAGDFPAVIDALLAAAERGVHA